MTALPAHARDASDVARELGVEPGHGLETAEATRRLAAVGQDLVGETRRASAVRILVDQVRSAVFALLAVAAVLSFLTGDRAEAIAIVAILLVNTGIGFGTEISAVRSMEALRRLGRARTKVRRDGVLGEVDARELVVGDVILLEPGDAVSADARIVSAARLLVDESTLTGESAPVEKEPAPVAEATPLAERVSMLYRGTTVARGTGEAVVVARGSDTELGKVARLVETTSRESTPLEKRLNRLGGLVGRIAVGVSAIVAVVGVLEGRDLLVMAKTGVALAIASVPEGLPIVATLALARGMLRMARRHALVRRLAAVETLGCTNVLLTDKTGTLTENRMRVAELALPERDLDLKRRSAAGDRDALHALEIGALCTSAALANDGSEDGVGDPLEVALLVAATRAGIPRASLLAKRPEVSTVPFDATTRLMATLHADGDGVLVAVKGSPETVVAAAERDAGGRRLDEALRADWLARAQAMGERGLRVLALAEKRAPSPNVSPFSDLTLVALVGLADPPRADASPAVAAAQGAGIHVVMATGDQAATATSIARAVGLASSETALPGSALDERSALTTGERDELARATVFSRVTPEEKLALVELHRSRGAVVAMIGDGVNDAPALKRADIGVAMGRRGTDAAREAADMVLTDDSFASVVAAVAEGRAIFANIRRAVVYLFSHTVGEVLIIGLAVTTGMPLPLLPLQILYLNLVTDAFPALALATGRGEAAAMSERPRDPREPFLARTHAITVALNGILLTLAVLASLAVAVGPLGLSARSATTVTFLSLALGAPWLLFAVVEPGARAAREAILRNPWAWAGLGAASGLAMLAVYVPALATRLALSPPTLVEWSIIAAAVAATALGSQLIIGVRAWATRARPRG